jgi:cytochrome P450
MYHLVHAFSEQAPPPMLGWNTLCRSALREGRHVSDLYHELAVIDLSAPDWWREPAVVTAPMLEAGAVAAFVPDFATVSFLRYDTCQAALGDPTLMAMGARYFEAQGWRSGPFVDWIRLNVVMMNPPGHTRLRKLVSRAFTPRAVASMRTVARRVAGQLCDAADEAGSTVEFVHDWARVLPLQVICEMIGVPSVDVAQMGEWAHGLSVASGMATEDARQAGDDAMDGFNEYVRAMIDERRNAPGDDLLSALIDAEEAGDRLTADELVAMVVQLVFAGHETTQNLLGNGMFRLLEHPDQLALLRERPALIPAAVEEMLRYDPPITFTSRIVTSDREIDGIPVQADQLIMLNLTAANHDPARFAHPTRFDVTRPDVRPLSFGYGAHFCLGANLARLEAEVAFTTLLGRYSAIEEVGESDWTSYTPLRGRQRLDLAMRL